MPYDEFITQRNAKIIKMLDDHRKKVEAMEPEEAKAYCRKMLIDMGMYTADGILTKRYGGTG